MCTNLGSLGSFLLIKGDGGLKTQWAYLHVLHLVLIGLIRFSFILTNLESEPYKPHHSCCPIWFMCLGFSFGFQVPTPSTEWLITQVLCKVIRQFSMSQFTRDSFKGQWEIQLKDYERYNSPSSKEVESKIVKRNITGPY